jgi:hypothetical protein
MNTDDINLAYKIRHALNETLDDLPPAATDRLAAARAAAIARKRGGASAANAAPRSVARPLFARLGEAVASLFSTPWVARTAVAVPLLAMAVGLVGVYQAEHEQRVAELADLDAAVLSDDLPLTAYIDHGFNAYLAEQQQQAPKRAQ